MDGKMRDMSDRMKEMSDRLHHVITMHGLGERVSGQMRQRRPIATSTQAGPQQRWAEPSSGPGRHSATAEDGGESGEQGIYCIEETDNVM